MCENSLANFIIQKLKSQFFKSQVQSRLAARNSVEKGNNSSYSKKVISKTKRSCKMFSFLRSKRMYFLSHICSQWISTMLFS